MGHEDFDCNPNHIPELMILGLGCLQLYRSRRHSCGRPDKLYHCVNGTALMQNSSQTLTAYVSCMSREIPKPFSMHTYDPHWNPSNAADEAFHPIVQNYFLPKSSTPAADSTM